jgi:RecJ-like exonuclease
MEGLVSCIRHYAEPGKEEYFLVSKKGDRTATGSFRSGFILKVGERAEFSPEEKAISAALSEEEGSAAPIREAIEKAAKSRLGRAPDRTGIAEVDGLTAKMWGRLEAAAAVLMRKLIIAAPIVVRFHNDTDGISGAYCLSKAIAEASAGMGEGYAPNIHWRMHSAVAYSREDATTDTLVTNGYECVERPLLVVLDFGTAKESNDGVLLARDRFDVIWLDHHPLVEGFIGLDLENYINPWMFGGDSNYTAGFLACSFAKTFSGFESREMENASFIGDYSKFARPTDSSRRLAALLDLITSDTRVAIGLKSSNFDPREIDAILDDKGKSEELIAYAENRVQEMLDSAIESVKIYQGSASRVYVADFEGIRGEDEQRYPLPGRFASKLLDKLEQLNTLPCVLMLHFGHFISLRMSKELTERIDLLRMLNEVREEYPDDVDSSGGHGNAASIKLKQDTRKKEIMGAVIRKLKEAA